MKRFFTRKSATLGAGGGAHFLHDGFSDSLLVLFPLWAEAFGFSYAQIGFLKMTYTGALAGFQVPAGFLAERLGERRLLVLGTIVSALGFLCFGLAGGFVGLVLCLLVAGFGSSVQHPLSSSLVSKAYGSGRRRAALGVYNFTGDMGKVIIPVSVAAIAAAYGWHTGAFALGIFGMACAVPIYGALKYLGAGGPPDQLAPEQTPQSRPPETGGWGFRDVRGFCVLSAIAFVDGHARAAFLTFMPFLLIGKGAAVASIGFALALTMAGGAAGKLSCGLLAERIGVIRTVVLTEIGTGIGILLLVQSPLEVCYFLLPPLGLCLNGTSSVLYGTVGDFIEPERQSRAFGLFYTMGIGASALAPPVYGLLSDAVGVGTTLTILSFTVLLTLPLCLSLRPSLAAASTKP
jgi:MFS transporter, FSR family, fosmidomycin resistance protein